jgi:hypothetical protein
VRILDRLGVPVWFAGLAAVSALLLVCIHLSYALIGHGMLTTVLFWLGMGGENNIGSWWSGMLFAIGAVLAFDGFANAAKPLHERRGWCASSLLISFYVVASAAANAVGVDWDPAVLGTTVSLRGVALALLIVTSAVILPTAGRGMNAPRAMLLAAAVAASAVAWSSSQLLWCALPALWALWLYSIESRGAVVKSAPATAVATAA